MEVKILGPGCPNCKKLEQSVRAAAAELQLEPEIEKVEDMQEIMSFGVMSTPALVIDSEVAVAGRIPDREELLELLDNA
jgi:small redox-active disulfide protein 2